MITLSLYYLQSRSFNFTIINSVTERDAEVLIAAFVICHYICTLLHPADINTQ